MALKQKIYETEAEKKKDFWKGVWLWFGLNILLGLCSWGVSIALASLMSSSASGMDTSGVYSIAYIILGILPWLINIGLIIYFAFTRSQIALGMLAGFGIALLIVLCLGLIVAAACFVILGSYNNP